MTVKLHLAQETVANIKKIQLEEALPALPLTQNDLGQLTSSRNVLKNKGKEVQNQELRSVLLVTKNNIMLPRCCKLKQPFKSVLQCLPVTSLSTGNQQLGGLELQPDQTSSDDFKKTIENLLENEPYFPHPLNKSLRKSPKFFKKNRQDIG